MAEGGSKIESSVGSKRILESHEDLMLEGGAKNVNSKTKKKVPEKNGKKISVTDEN